MLDRYWFGQVSRISPEAPVPIVNLEKEVLIAGGAANVAANIKSLGAVPYLVGIVGDDFGGQELKNQIELNGVTSEFIFQISDRTTTLKTRIVAHQQQLSRIDSEVTENLSIEKESELFEQISYLFEKVDIVLISDYGKGFLSDSLTMRLIRQANKKEKKILVDPKGKNYQKYKNATLLTPNRKEAFEATMKNSVKEAGQILLSELNLESLIITLGEDGLSIFEKNKEFTQLKSVARHVYDVTGAGDTVIAALSIALVAGGDLCLAAEIANLAAGFAVEEVGTATVSLEKLKKYFERSN